MARQAERDDDHAPLRREQRIDRKRRSSRTPAGSIPASPRSRYQPVHIACHLTWRGRPCHAVRDRHERAGAPNVDRDRRAGLRRINACRGRQAQGRDRSATGARTSAEHATLPRGARRRARASGSRLLQGRRRAGRAATRHARALRRQDRGCENSTGSACPRSTADQSRRQFRCRRPLRSNISSTGNISLETIAGVTQHDVDGRGALAGARLVSDAKIRSPRRSRSNIISARTAACAPISAPGRAISSSSMKSPARPRCRWARRGKR